MGNNEREEDTKGPKYIIQGPVVTFYLKCGTPYSMFTYKSPITNKVYGILLGGKFSNVDVIGDTTRSCVAMMKVRLYQLTLKFNRRKNKYESSNN